MMAPPIPVAGDDHSAAIAVPTRRMPAWKRLGLKLKFANDHADLPAKLDSSALANKKRQREANSQSLSVELESQSEQAPKKRPRLDSPNTPLATSNGIDGKSMPPSKESSSLKKSVSFTSDTKQEDGDSSRSLIADWEAQYDRPSFSANSQNHSEPLEQSNSRSQKSDFSVNPKKPHVALEYLTSFRQARETWKFSKNKEVWILNHLFSIDEIPSEYDVTLSHYLAGLKSSAARSRLQQEAAEIVKSDQEQQIEKPVLSSNDDGTTRVNTVPTNMENPDRRKAYYEDSIRKYKRKLEQHLDQVAEEDLNWVSPERLAKRRRAEIILWATGVSPPTAEATQSSDSTTLGRGVSRSTSHGPENGSPTDDPRKKRKNRTSVIELSSSSEDESSDSSSGSDSEDKGGEEDSDERRSSSSKATATHTQSSTSSQSGQEPGSGDDSESSSGSSESSDDYDASLDKTTINGGRPKSVISISS